MENVKVIVSIAGHYCSYEEISIDVQYDLTNNKSLGIMSKKELEERMETESFDGYSDYQTFDAILVDGKYYVNL